MEVTMIFFKLITMKNLFVILFIFVCNVVYSQVSREVTLYFENIDSVFSGIQKIVFTEKVLAIGKEIFSIDVPSEYVETSILGMDTDGLYEVTFSHVDRWEITSIKSKIFNQEVVLTKIDKDIYVLNWQFIPVKKGEGFYSGSNQNTILKLSVSEIQGGYLNIGFCPLSTHSILANIENRKFEFNIYSNAVRKFYSYKEVTDNKGFIFKHSEISDWANTFSPSKSDYFYLITSIDLIGNTMEFEKINSKIGLEKTYYLSPVLLSLLRSEFELVNSKMRKHNILYFWGRWCKPCLSSISHFQSALSSLNKDNFSVLFVEFSSKNNLEENKTIELRYPNISTFLGSELDILNTDLMITIYPTYILHDANGLILMRTSSYTELFQYINDNIK